MTLVEAIEILQTSKDVDDWNTKREAIKSQVTQDEWFAKYAPVIDGSGIIVEILKDQLL